MLAAVTGALVLGSGCSDGGGTPPPDNVAPVANFTLPVPACVINVACTFTDASTDDDAVTGWSWDFNGDGTADATTQDAAHTYTVAGTFSVILTVRDAEGLTHSKTTQITIAPVTPGNTPPVAGFTNACTAAACTFTNTSTDVDGTITYLWNFGEPASGTNNESTLEDPTHSYTVTVPTSFTVTLTVTDDDGATDVETQTISVSPAPPGATDCTPSGVNVDCVLDITARATLNITLTSVSCELAASAITIRPPVGPKQVFGNACFRDVPEEFTLSDDTGAPRVLEAGTQLTIRFIQGTSGGVPPANAPAARLEGTFPNWTIRIDDGAAGPGEPDFNDVVLTVETPAQ
jgi:PKD repeat protein